jgi:cbb3-type cytochrome oxidase maturation protein
MAACRYSAGFELNRMSVIIILMLASLAVGLVFVAAFVWSVRSGQFEDTLTPSMRVLGEEKPAKLSEINSNKPSHEH